MRKKKTGLQTAFDIDPNILTLHLGLGFYSNDTIEIAISYLCGIGFEKENDNMKFDQGIILLRRVQDLSFNIFFSYYPKYWCLKKKRSILFLYI